MPGRCWGRPRGDPVGWSGRRADVPWLLTDILLALPVFALVLIRLSGLVMTAPILGSNVVPLRFRAAFAMVIAAMIFPIVRVQAPAELTLGMALGGAASELMVGAIIGLSMSILLAGGEVAGLIVGRQASISLASIFDPVRSQQTSSVGQLYTIVLTLVFLLAGGHRAMVAALLDTYSAIPLLSFQFDESFVVLLVEMLAAAFVLGIRLAGPVLIALFLLGTALAFLSRTMPQLNVLTVGFTLRMLVGMGVAALALMVGEELMLDAVWDGVTMMRATFGLDPAENHLVM